LYCSDGILLRAYGAFSRFTKIGPLRIIISFIDNPLYSLASFLHNVIKNNVSKLKTHIDNSFKLVEKT